MVLKYKPASESPGRLRKTQISDQAGLGLGLRGLYKSPDDAAAAGLAAHWKPLLSAELADSVRLG